VWAAEVPEVVQTTKGRLQDEGTSTVVTGVGVGPTTVAERIVVGVRPLEVYRLGGTSVGQL
jgi:hypothetical protein